MSLSTVTMNISDLVPDPKNPRTHDQRNLDAIRSSLDTYGQVEPILVQKSTNMVIAGNGRMSAMKSLGWDTVVVALLDVDDKEARELSIALNRSGELAGWDEEILAQHLRDLSSIADDFNPEGLGFSMDEFEALSDAYADDIQNLVEDIATEEAASDETSAQESELPPNTSPSHMPSSTAKVVQLFLDENTHTKFQMAVRRLATIHKTDNITDTVYKTVISVAETIPSESAT